MSIARIFLRTNKWIIRCRPVEEVETPPATIFVPLSLVRCLFSAGLTFSTWCQQETNQQRLHVITIYLTPAYSYSGKTVRDKTCTIEYKEGARILYHLLRGGDYGSAVQN